MNEWGKLNQRQQFYLKAIFDQDQDQERAHKQSSSMYHYNSTPATVWRKIEYADTMYGHTPLKAALVEAHLVDQGTGSTFKALQERGLIETSGNLFGGTVHIWITRQGRKLVRDAQGVTSPKILPTGQLREWHWKALCRAYLRGDQGFHSDRNYEGDPYDYVSWKTILRLRDYKVHGEEQSLVEERRFPREYSCEAGHWLNPDPYDHRICITDYGKQYVENHLEEYQTLYPDVLVPIKTAIEKEK